VNSIAEIIEVTGGWDRLRERPLRIEVEGFMPLSIEVIGTGPRGGTALSIMHWFIQNGDVMRDPDLIVEILPQVKQWLSVSYRQDSLGLYQEAVYAEGDGVVVRSRLVDDLVQFMRLWDRNLREQGFVEAARRQAN
jgi:hypothetical protein